MTRQPTEFRRGTDRDIDLYCKLDSVQGLVGALSSVKWKKQQDAVCELSEHGLIFIMEELNCLHAKVYFRKELFREYQYRAEVRLRLGVSLSVLVDCLNAFAPSTGATALELRYPGQDMQLLLKLTDAHHTCTDAEIRTRIPDTIPRDYTLQDDINGSPPVSFAIRSQALKEAIDDLEWPGSSVLLSLTPDPPTVTFKAEGHGDLQIDFFYDRQTDLFIDFKCDRHVSFWYKYKYLRATTANIPNSILKDNRGSKLTIDSTGLLKLQHIFSLRSPTPSGPQQDASGTQGQATRTSYVEFFVMPEEETGEEEYPMNGA